MNARRDDIAVLIPCYNEAQTIAGVIAGFHAVLPEAIVYVYDNNSADDTAARARAAGAVVAFEPLRGKGNVVRRMFADIEADVYVMVDGDDTYDAADAPALIRRLTDDTLDMVNGRRVTAAIGAYRPGHRFGNRFLTSVVAWIFGKRLRDMLSGYKVFSRRYVKSFPALSSGFETEAELAVHALELRMPIGEIDIRYRERPEGSTSKLRTFRDGVRILRTILRLAKEERPLQFFGAFAGLVALFAASLAVPVIDEYLRTGEVPRLPTAILSMGLTLLAFAALACGLVLDTVTLGRREMKRLHYLAVPRHHPPLVDGAAAPQPTPRRRAAGRRTPA
jgi:glycosyltransferase involved in cell wall biosynthesis